MKFRKEFHHQMVPEWAEIYMDYDGLERILQEIERKRQGRHHLNRMRSLQHKLKLDRAISGKHLQDNHHKEDGDVEEAVIDVNTLEDDDSKCRFKTDFLRNSEEGGEIEAMLFEKLDAELNKVNAFYQDKVNAVMEDAALLNEQMDALIALRMKVRKRKHNPERESVSATSAVFSSADNEQEVHNINESNHHEEEPHFNNCDDDPLEVLDRVKIKKTPDSPISTIRGVFTSSKEEELSFNTDELQKVEQQLKRAFIEFYRKLLLLKHYSFLNLSAFSKIMKKYEKVTSRRAWRAYMKVVDNSFLGSSDEIDCLLERVECIFIRNFSHSNSRKGMKLLRPKAKREKHRVTFFTGFFSGCLVVLLVAIILRMTSQNIMKRKEGTFYMQNIFPLYSLFGYIILHMLMYAANIYFWRRYRVNYPFIFGIKPGTELGYREVLLLSTGLAVLALGGFLLNLHLEMDLIQRYKTVTQLVPVIMISIVLVVLFCPFDIIYRSSRFFFIRTIFRILCAPLYQVTFPDFFLCDHLTSQIQALRSFVLYICYYGLGEHSRRQEKCHSHGLYNTLCFVVVTIPIWLRLLQGIRRLCEERELTHAFSCVVNLSSIVAIVIRTIFEFRKGVTSWLVLALISSVIAVLVNTYSDIVYDWGLLRWHSRNFLLRDKLIIPHKSVYYAAMVIDAALRIAWMQLVLAFNMPSLHRMAATTAISCLEIVRRGIWSFFRLENEHLNNVGRYRAFKSVPLPFSYFKKEEEDDDNEETEEKRK